MPQPPTHLLPSSGPTPPWHSPPSPLPPTPLLPPFKDIMSLIRNCLLNRISHGNLLSPPIHSVSSCLVSCNFLLISETQDHLRDINSYLFFDPVTADMPGHHPQPLGHWALTGGFPPESAPPNFLLLLLPLPFLSLPLSASSSGGSNHFSLMSQRGRAKAKA